MSAWTSDSLNNDLTKSKLKRPAALPTQGPVVTENMMNLWQADGMKEAKPVTWRLAPNCLIAGRVNLLIGEEGTGKSTQKRKTVPDQSGAVFCFRVGYTPFWPA